MDIELQGRTALVTGASQGIGKAIATGLAQEGVRVALVARRADLLSELAGQLAAAGAPTPEIVEADLYDPQAIGRIVATARSAMGRIDILINAAGGSRTLPIDAPAEQWDEAILLNFARIRELTHAVLPVMQEGTWGRIINITGGSEPRAINAANAAKAAVHAWSKGLSREIARQGITINNIKPGRIISEQVLRIWPTEADQMAFAETEIPIGRFGKAEEVAALVVFLCSPLAGYITGASIPVDGGFSRFAF